MKTGEEEETEKKTLKSQEELLKNHLFLPVMNDISLV